MNVERLERLAAILDSVDPATFNLSTWYAEDSGHNYDTHGADPSDSPCGFVACAVGWACMDPWMNEQGLRMVDGAPFYDGPITGVPEGGSFFHHSGWNGLRYFFGLANHDVAQCLFSDSAYPTGSRTKPGEVAARIRQYIQSGTIGSWFV